MENVISRASWRSVFVNPCMETHLLLHPGQTSGLLHRLHILVVFRFKWEQYCWGAKKICSVLVVWLCVCVCVCVRACVCVWGGASFRKFLKHVPFEVFWFEEFLGEATSCISVQGLAFALVDRELKCDSSRGKSLAFSTLQTRSGAHPYYHLIGWGGGFDGSRHPEAFFLFSSRLTNVTFWLSDSHVNERDRRLEVRNDYRWLVGKS
jgi:hypothetical protein